MTCNDNASDLDIARRNTIVRVTANGESVVYDPNALKAAVRQINNRDPLNQANGRVRPSFVQIGTPWIK